jgi:serine/threonine-protein kinase
VNPRDDPAARRQRLLFEEIVDLEPDERVAHLGRLDPNDPDVARVARLLDAHDRAAERLDALEFLRAPEADGRANASFDAVAAFAPTYVIEGELHGGGMSRVFFGRDAKLGRKIVAKVLPPGLGAEVSLGRFQQEIRLAAQLRHPHIVPLLESGEAAGCLYYTMPLIEGESLRDRLRRDGKLPVPVALRLATEIADALGYAHGLGIIHRDIKPGNVLIDSGHAIVTDFGIARALSDAATATITRPGTVIGTPAYMSPEQALSGGVVDARSDIYSLGCVLYEMLYGALPFAGAVAFGPAERASQARVPARVRAVVARAMASRPVERFQSAQEMHEALVAAGAPRVGPRALWATIAASVVLILGAAVAFRPATDHTFASPQAVVQQVTTRGDVILAAITPGGKYVAFTTSDSNLRVGEIGAGTQGIISTAHGLSPRSWPFQHISWSPDGTVLFYVSNPVGAVTAIQKLGPWRMVIANPLLAGPILDVWQDFRSVSGFAISPVDSTLAVWVMPSVRGTRDGVVTRDTAASVILRRGARRGGGLDTIDVRIDMAWGSINFSPNGRWLGACGGSLKHQGTWRVALIATHGTTQTLLDSADAPRASCGVIWSPRGDSLYVWPTTPGAGMMSYAIDDASGQALGPPAPFRLPQPSGERTAFTLSADGKRVAYVQHTPRRYVAIAELGAGIDVPSRDAELGARDPSRPEISPAGDRFAYVVAEDSGSAIYTRDLRGGEPRRLSRDYREGLAGVRWSDDAKRLATLTRRDSQPVILILDAAGSELMTLRPKHAVYDTSLFRPSYAWAAHSTAIMYNAVDLTKGRAEVWITDLASGQERRLLAPEDGSSTHELSLPVWSPDGKSILYDSSGVLSIKDAATGRKHPDPASGGEVPPCHIGQATPCNMGTGVPLLWRTDGWFFSEALNPDGTTTIWRSSVSQPPKLYARLGKECKLISMDRDAHRAVCQVYRDESDVFVVTRP